jgi:antirestriction protein ArdC
VLGAGLQRIQRRSVDGYQEEVKQQLPESERIENAEAFFRALPATINYGGDHAY